MGRAPREHYFIETDGQVYLVEDRDALRFPRTSEDLPFEIDVTARMDFGDDVLLRAKPRLDRHPEEWHNRDALFSEDRVDELVKRAVYMTMHRCVSEVMCVRGDEVLMVHAVRGFSKGYWNLPGGFLDFGESPEDAARRETAEEVGVAVELDELVGTYLSGFPGKPSYTLGFVYRGRAGSDPFVLKSDEVDDARYFPIPKAVTLTRNPLAKWAMADLYRRLPDAAVTLEVHRHGLRKGPASGAPIALLDRDGVINRGRKGYVRTPADMELLEGAGEAIARLRDAGYRTVVVSNQDVMGWKLVGHDGMRGIHDRMLALLRKEGADLDEIYYCPHHVLSDCLCRKPMPGMLLQALRDFDMGARRAWIVGDKPSDVAAGHALGTWTAFVGDKTRQRRFAEDLRTQPPNVTATSLSGAVREILKRRHERFAGRPA